MSTAQPYFGAIEAGGTKFVCAIGDRAGHVLAEQRFATADAASTIDRMLLFLRMQSDKIGAFAAIGLGSFGPVELNKGSSRYGFIGSTPKPGWSGIDLVGSLRREFSCPVGFDTDVNAAALAEHRWGSATDVENLVYTTVGTGIGCGVLIDRKPIHGLMHPEIGHIYPRRHRLDTHFAGVCPFHQDCLEGLASGPAIVARSGAELKSLDPTHAQWEIEADYLGQLCAQLVLTVSPERIVMGGGVMDDSRLLPAIRHRLQHWLRGYVGRPELLSEIDRYVAAAGLGSQAGVLGALALAIDAANLS